MKNLYCFVLLIGAFLSHTYYGYAQTPTTQDCLGAIPICLDRYEDAEPIPDGMGNYPNEINGNRSCLRNGEVNPVWYTFTVNSTGLFGFEIIPNDLTDDYDWALYNLTNASCEDIARLASIEVSCNYSGAVGTTGPNGRSNQNSGPAAGSPFNALITVQEGNTYALVISNWTRSPNGYTIDFTPTDANTGIFNLDPPQIREVTLPEEVCDRTLTLEFTENIDCNSLVGFEAFLEGPAGSPTYTVRANIPECNLGAIGARRVFLEINPLPRIVGNYTLTVPFNGSNNFLTDACGNPFFAGQTPGEDLVYDFTLTGSIEPEITVSPGDICQDGSLTLGIDIDNFVFPIGFDVEWSNGVSGNGFSAPDEITITEPGTYSVTLTNGCQIGAATVTIEGGVDLDLGPDQTGLCATDGPQILDAGEAQAYLWNTGQTSRTINVTQTGTYSVTVTPECGPPVEDEIFLEFTSDINYNPVLSHYICSTATPFTIGQNIGNEYNYIWSNGSTSPTIGVSLPGQYSVTVSNDCGPIERNIQVDVEIVPAGGYVIEDFTICPGESTIRNFNLSPFASIAWTGTSGTSSDNSYTINQPGSHGFIVSNACGNFPGSFEVVNGTPEIQFTGNPQACENQTTQITASGGVSYNWLPTGENTPTINAQAGQTYTVEVTNAVGCTATESISVNTLPVASAQITGNTNFCVGESTNLTVVSSNANDTYLWSTGETSSAINVDEAGTYSVRVRTAAGCIATNTISIIQNPLPTLSIQNSATCNPSLEDYTITLTVSQGASLTTNNPQVTVEESNGLYTLTALAGLSFDVIVTNPSTNCTFTQTITPPECDCPDLAAPSSVQPTYFYCAGEAIPEISASVGSDEEVRWYRTASGGAAIATGNSIRPNTAGTYYAESRAIVSGCVSRTRLAIEIIERTSPNVSFSNERQVCVGESLLLTASGGTNYVWNTGATSPSINVGAGNYEVTLTDENGCQNSATVNISNFPEPNAIITGDNTFCVGEQANLSASGGVSYAWSTGQSGNTISVNQAQTISVSVTDTNGCQDETSVEVVENELPFFTTQQSATCNDALTEYNIVGTLSTDAIIQSSAGAIEEVNGVYTITVPEETNVTLTITNLITGCEATQSITAPDCSCPVLAAPNGIQEFFYCPDDAIPTIRATSSETNADVRWYDVQSGGTVIATANDFQPTQAGIYFAETFEAISGCASSSRLAVQVTERVRPNINFNSDEQVCVGETLLLTASGGLNYVWDSGETTATITAGAGEHRVTVTDVNGCINEASTTIGQFPEAVAVIDGESNFCAGEQAALSASGGVNYVWSTGANNDFIFVNQAQTVSVTVTDTNGCQDETSVEVVENELPIFTTQQAATCNDALTEYTIVGTLSTDAAIRSSTGIIEEVNGVYTITVPEEFDVILTITNASTGCENTQSITAPDCSCPVLAAPNGIQEFFYCPDDAIPMISATSAETNTDVRWYDVQSGGTIIATANDFQPTQAGTYFAETFEANSGCASSSRLAVQVTERARPNISFSSDEQVCVGETLLLTASGGTSYLWDSGETTATITAGAGEHRVTVTDVNGCINEASTTIGQFPEAVASISGELGFCAGEQTSLSASGGVNYAWSTGESNDLIFVNQAQTVSVTVTDTNGCQDETSVEVVENELPIFTTQQAAACNDDLTEYTIVGTLSSDAILQSSAGIVEETNGIYTITVPEEIDVILTITNADTGCANTQSITAPDCSCPVLAAPDGVQEFFYCPDDAIPVISATSAETNTDVRWYNVQSGGTVIATANDFQPTQAGTYFAETFEANSGCVSSTRLAVQVTERARPNISFSSDGQVCAGETLLLTAAGGVNYLWDSGETTAEITVGTGEYSVTVTDINGCTNEASTTIAQFPEAVASIDGEASFCLGESTTLTASGGINYAWSTGETSEQIQVNQVQNISVTVTDANGCVAETNVDISENELPTFTTQQSALCADNLTTYSVVGTLSENASLEVSAGTISESGGIYTITIPADISIEILLRNEVTGCENTLSIAAPDCNCPSLAAPLSDGDIEICADQNLPSLNVIVEDTETQNVNWYADAGATMLLATNTLEYTPDETGTYFAQSIEISSGCVSSQLTPITISELSLPIITFSEANQVCPDETLELIVSGGLNYLWNTGETTPNIEVGDGTYSVIVTDANGCQNEASTVISTFSPPVAAINGDESYCAGENVTLTGEGGTLIWSTGEMSEQIVVDAGEYMLTVTDENGCQDVTTWSVSENALPTLTPINNVACTPNLTAYEFQANISEDAVVFISAGTFSENNGIYSFSIPADSSLQISLTDVNTRCIQTFDIIAPNCDCPSLSAPTSMGDLAICEGESIPTLQAMGGDENFAIDWFDAPIGGTLLAEASAAFTPSEAGTYYVSLREIISNCTSSFRTPITLTINELPSVSITGDDAVCANETSTLNAIGDGSFTWSSGENTNEIQVSAGVYEVTLTDVNNCQNIASFDVAEVESPVAEILDAPSQLCENEMASLRASGNGMYLWNTDQNSDFININSAGTYSLTVINSEGCSDETSVDVTLNSVDAIQLDLGEDGVLCEDESILLDAGTFEGVTYRWQDGSSASNFEVTDAGQYAVTITDECDNVYTDVIRFERVSTISEQAAQSVVGQDTSLCFGEVILDVSRIQLDNPGNFNFTWTGGSNDERLRINESGTYGLRMSNECGAAFASIEVEDCPECYVYVPNTFSPSSATDINTRLRPFLGKDCDVSNYEFHIFDRWGNLIFETQNLDDLGWDGKFREASATQGTYIWIMTYEIADRYGTIRSRQHSGDILVNW